MICKKCGNEVENGKAFCPYCGEQLNATVNDGSQNGTSGSFPNTNNLGYQATPNGALNPQMSQPYTPPKKKKKKLPKFIAIAVVIIIAIVAISSLSGSDSGDETVKNTDPVGKRYIDLVRTGYPVYLEDIAQENDITYGKVFSSFFSDGEWEYFDSDDGYKVVEYHGTCSYIDSGEDAYAQVQFTIDDDENGFQTYITLIDDEEYDIDQFIETVFDNYMTDNGIEY